jgi:hypothetical protein
MANSKTIVIQTDTIKKLKEMVNINREKNYQLKAQLARLDDVEGLAKVIDSHYDCSPDDIAQAVINYIKGV